MQGFDEEYPGARYPLFSRAFIAPYKRPSACHYKRLVAPRAWIITRCEHLNVQLLFMLLKQKGNSKIWVVKIGSSKTIQRSLGSHRISLVDIVQLWSSSAKPT